MIYVVWSLLNIGIFLFFIVICFRATKLIKEKLGLFASIVFIFGLLSFIGPSDINESNKKPYSNLTETWKSTQEDTVTQNTAFSKSIVLEKTLIAKHTLHIRFGKKQQGDLIPISSFTSTTGLVSGTTWNATAIIINRVDGTQKLEYEVDAIVVWNLLGATIFSQAKEYKGITLPN